MVESHLTAAPLNCVGGFEILVAINIRLLTESLSSIPLPRN
jgi:hypothetical protein